MKIRTLFKIALVGVVAVCIAGIGGLYAGTAVQDVIKMENKAYAKHTKGVVDFTHKKHVTDYKAGCGDCHHDEKGQPLTSLKEGDDVKNCIECHTKTDKKPKGAKLSKEEERAYHYEAIHDNCQGCHRDYNKKNKTKAAPTTCKKCHPKE